MTWCGCRCIAWRRKDNGDAVLSVVVIAMRTRSVRKVWSSATDSFRRSPQFRLLVCFIHRPYFYRSPRSLCPTGTSFPPRAPFHVFYIHDCSKRVSASVSQNSPASFFASAMSWVPWQPCQPLASIMAPSVVSVSSLSTRLVFEWMSSLELRPGSQSVSEQRWTFYSHRWVVQSPRRRGS